MSTTPPSPRHHAGVLPHARNLVLATAIGYCLNAEIVQADALQASFNPTFLQGPGGRNVDVTRFERGNPVAAGSYRLDVYVNQSWVGRQEVRVGDTENKQSMRYCFKRSQLSSLGLDVERLPKIDETSDADCISITEHVPEALAVLDLSTLRLDLSIPQAYLNRALSGYVDPRDWDRGVTAAFIDYNGNTLHSDAGGQNTNQFYVGFNAGVNLGDWRLRHNGSYNRSSAAGATVSQYDAVSSYAQRDITELKSQLTLGEYYTPADLFDSVPYTGVQLTSDDRMLPDSQRGFAPAVRGTAETNARVTVRQGGAVLYETSVAPGPFIIDDLHSTGYSGDLDVTVTEADGRIRSFVVPYASVAQLLRPGTARYSVTAGRYRDDSLQSKPVFVQGTYQQGISNLWTGYTGSIIADQYMAVQGGLALSTPVGAFAFDVTHSNASGLDAEEELSGSSSGQSYRLSYSKLVETSRTNFVVAAYRFSSAGYLSFSDFIQAHDATQSPRRQRNRLQVNVNQPLGDHYGSLFISGSAQNYWKTGEDGDIGYQAGYSNSFRWGSMSLSASRTETGQGDTDTQYMLTLSLPLGRSSYAPHLNSSATYSDKGELNSQVGVSGSLGEFNQFNYGVYGTQSHTNEDSSSASGVNVQYRAASANLSGNYSDGDGYRQVGMGLSGSIVAHPGGVTFSQAQGETRAIVEAKGAKGAALLNSSGAEVNGSGYGVVSSLMPYRQNEVALDPKGTADDVELQLTSQNVAPRYGAVVMLKYPTITGEPVLLLVRDDNGEMLPVGAEVLDAQGNSLTLVGQGSRVFIRAAEREGELTVRWGQGEDRQCRVHYRLPPSPAKGSHTSHFRTAETLCSRLSRAPQVATH
ncbi:fimbrial biogenesis outer membrane usher protein [Pseudomonas taiwanensis]|uniref:fimbria/pilus outer membrane usher protein n=1 Tax=Pseudomonas taiwanensis TaxID=470150 RepID=UPI0015BB4786|nr:fimbria/pilus outer membrane usher protein [Pseudomonas taiwanensis]NWL80839.1 fimbrial biogenesis outer membrane usher protein [Pseudomonas taiwanensis]